MNEEIVKAINEKTTQEEEKTADDFVTWLIFSIGTERYAFASSDVQEIIRDMDVYPFPFLPSYIDGIINRRGDPCTVINPLLLLNKEAATAAAEEKVASQTASTEAEENGEEERDEPPVLNKKKGSITSPSSLFLVLNRSDDQLCLRISDILFFHETHKSDIHSISNATVEDSFYVGTVDYHHSEIPVLSSDAFELRLRKDLGSA